MKLNFFPLKQRVLIFIVLYRAISDPFPSSYPVEAKCRTFHVKIKNVFHAIAKNLIFVVNLVLRKTLLAWRSFILIMCYITVSKFHNYNRNVYYYADFKGNRR